MKSVLLSVKNLCYLENGPYSFDVYENSVIGLTGASGIGKTQMLRAMVDAISSTGDISLKGRLMSDFEAPVWRQNVALVPAESAWWKDTVGAHFQYCDIENQLLPALQAVGFEHHTLLWKAARLSTGEKQRLALVRALAIQPSVVLLDEPCSALDEKSVNRVEKLLAEYVLQPGRALVWVSHDLDQLRRVSDTCYRVTANELKQL